MQCLCDPGCVVYVRVAGLEILLVRSPWRVEILADE